MATGNKISKSKEHCLPRISEKCSLAVTCVTSSWKLRWVPQKWNLAFSLLLGFNKKDEACSEEGWSWCTVLSSSVVLHVTWLTPTGTLQPSHLCPTEVPRARRKCGGTGPPRCLPAWDSHHAFSPPSFSFLNRCPKKGPVHIETAAHSAIVSSTHFRTCYRTLSCKSHSEKGLTVCAIMPFEITVLFPWVGASCMGTRRK